MIDSATFARSGQLAVKLQEVFTAAARLRANRMSTVDAAAFRNNIKQALTKADRDARQLGYSGDIVKHAVYALVVLIDECVLNSALPGFQSWHGKPLQEEVFGDHRGGELFFENLATLIAQPDSEELADLLEIYHLCLLLGFQGRYAGQHRGELTSIAREVSDKIHRIRGAQPELTPSWLVPQGEKAPVSKDPWVKRLGIAAMALWIVAVLVFLAFTFVIRSGAANLNELVANQVEVGTQ
jgi:type VI secretion system protein ImpK